jgi:predicted N-acetyltransferase YhbS
MVTVRPGKARDLDTICHIHGEAFGAEEGPEIIDLVRALLSDPTAEPVLSLVAEASDELVGHVLFTRVTVEGASVPAQILAPLAVVPSHQKHGVGGALIQDGLARLTKSGVALVFVLGHPSYYPRFGFEAVGDRELVAPYPIPPEHREGWMVQSLQPGLPGKVRGTVRCAAALDRPEYW